METRQALNLKMLKLVNILRDLVSIIEIQGYHKIVENLEYLEHLPSMPDGRQHTAQSLRFNMPPICQQPSAFGYLLPFSVVAQ